MYYEYVLRVAACMQQSDKSLQSHSSVRVEIDASQHSTTRGELKKTKQRPDKPCQQQPKIFKLLLFILQCIIAVRAHRSWVDLFLTKSVLGVENARMTLIIGSRQDGHGL